MKNDTKVIQMNGTDVTVEFVPDSISPFRQADTGTMKMTINGAVTEYRYVTTSFVPFPFPGPAA